MTLRRLRASLAASTLALLLLPLAACSAPAPVAPLGEDDVAVSSAPTTAPEEQAEVAASGDAFGCTEAVLAYANEHGYPAAVPLDPATLDIPLASVDVAPDCYIVDDETGAKRYGAFWGTDPEGVLGSLGSALTGAGYVQSEDYGPLVWWIGGDDPMTAEHAIAAAIQPEPIDGTQYLWATWGP